MTCPSNLICTHKTRESKKLVPEEVENENSVTYSLPLNKTKRVADSPR